MTYYLSSSLCPKKNLASAFFFAIWRSIRYYYFTDDYIEIDDEFQDLFDLFSYIKLRKKNPFNKSEDSGAFYLSSISV